MFVNSLRMYGLFARASVRSQMQYKVSFVMQTIAAFVLTALDLVGLGALFWRFHHIEGWEFKDILVFYGLANTAFSTAEALSRGFDAFGDTLKAGDFDRLLLRPRSTVLQLFGQELTLRRLGRFSQGAIALALGLRGRTLVFEQELTMVFAYCGAVIFFIALFIFQATLMFWSVESLKIMDSVTYGGVETSQYPISIYGGGLRRFFTFVVPVATVIYFPMLAVLGKDDTFLHTTRMQQELLPLVAVLFFSVSLFCWRRGIRRYQSTGS